MRPCLSASASQKRQFTVVRLLGRSRNEGARELTSDLVHEAGAGSRDQEAQQVELSELDAVCDAEGEEASYRNPELCDRYKSLPLATIQHGDLTQLPGFREAMVVVGGETEGGSRPHTSAVTAARDLNCSSH